MKNQDGRSVQAFLGAFLGFLVIWTGAVDAARAGCTTAYEYDGAGSVTRTRVYDGAVTHSDTVVTYDALGRESTRIQRVTEGSNTGGLATLYVYDVQGRVVTQVKDGADLVISGNANELGTIYEYDVLGRQTRVQGPVLLSSSTRPETLYEYDLSGSMTLQEVLLDDVEGTPIYAATETEYDALGRATKVTDPEGHYRTTVYDSLSRPIREYRYNVGDVVLSQSRTTYDGAGRVITRAQMLDAGSASAIDVTVDQVTLYAYDADGRVVTQTSFNMGSDYPLLTVYEYDGLGQLTRTTNPLGFTEVQEYEPGTGRVTQRISDYSDGIGARTTSLSYDDAGRMTQMIAEGDPGDANDQITTSYAYDCLGRRLGVTDGTGRVMSYRYDLLGRQDRQVEDVGGLNRTTDYTYNGLGQQDSLIAYIAGGNNQTTEYGYGETGRVRMIRYPDSTGDTDVIVYMYDMGGRVILRKDQSELASGPAMIYAYDRRGLMTVKRHEKQGPLFGSYTYDGVGRMVTGVSYVSGSPHSMVTYAYDDLSRVTLETQDAGSSTTHTMYHEYDQAGNRVTYVNTSVPLMTLTYAYDGLNRPVAVDRGGSALMDYAYDGQDMTLRRITTEYKAQTSSAADVFIDYAVVHDGHHRILGITNHTSNTETAGVATLAAFTYSYDAAGNRLSQTGSGFPQAREADYSYDTLHRLTQADYSQPSGVSTAFTYDLLGNRVQVEDSLNNRAASYVANLANEYTQIENQLPPYEVQAIVHDMRGNLRRDEGFATDTNGQEYFEYSYDPENRLQQVAYTEDAGSNLYVQAVYEYDGLGRRVAYHRYSPTGTLEETLRYLHDGQNMVAEYSDNGGTLTLRRSYVHGLQYIDERAVMRDHEGDGQDYYYLLQELYSVSGLATSNGLRAEHAVYDAYGQATLYAWPSADVNGDGTVNIFDLVAVRDALNTISPLHDVNLDGAVNIFDLVTVRGQLDTSAVATTTSNVGNPYYFTGRLTDTLHASDLLVANDPHFRRLQDNRNRTYDPKHGRWLQRDPLGVRPETPRGMIAPTKQYTDGMNGYAYVRSQPTKKRDPLGLTEWCDSLGCVPIDVDPPRDYLNTCRDVLSNACARYPNAGACSGARCVRQAESLCRAYVTGFAGLPNVQNGTRHDCMALRDMVLGLGLSNRCFRVRGVFRLDRGHVFAGVFHVCNKTTTTDANLDPWHWYKNNWPSAWWAYYYPETRAGSQVWF